MSLEILYQDNHLLAVNKMAGVTTQPAENSSTSLQDLAAHWVKEKFKKPGRVFLEPIHRIDKPVSGVVLFARTSKALSRCMASVREKKTEKEYLALVEGTVEMREGICRHFLKHGHHRALHAKEEELGAKEAYLQYTVKKQFKDRTLLSIKLFTGRYHQIRLQMSDLGHPILGDRKYHSHIPFLPGAIALHHQRFCIPHPVTQTLIEIQAPLPLAWSGFC